MSAAPSSSIGAARAELSADRHRSATPLSLAMIRAGAEEPEPEADWTLESGNGVLPKGISLSAGAVVVVTLCPEPAAVLTSSVRLPLAVSNTGAQAQARPNEETRKDGKKKIRRKLKHTP